MRVRLTACLLALAAATAPAMALADDPNDPTMRTAEARERDRAIIRQLNQNQLAYVRERDARYAEGWRAYREQGANDAEFAQRQADYETAQRDYMRQRSRYEDDMAVWRRTFAACQKGDYSACGQ